MGGVVGCRCAQISEHKDIRMPVDVDVKCLFFEDCIACFFAEKKRLQQVQGDEDPKIA